MDSPLLPRTGAVASLLVIESQHRNDGGTCCLDGEEWPCLHKATLSIHIANDLMAEAMPSVEEMAAALDGETALKDMLRQHDWTTPEGRGRIAAGVLAALREARHAR